MDDAKTIFDKFKQICPASTEQFDPKNINRWLYHIKSNESHQGYATYNMGDDTAINNANQLTKSRVFWTFSDMPKYIQQHYLSIADMFAGKQVIAVGSRVNGTYVDIFSDEIINSMRRILHKNNKVESDYDFYVIGVGVSDHGVDIPKWADFVPYLLPNQRAVFVPMWDFSKLPESEHAKTLQLITDKDWYELVKVHDKFKLSVNTYCCDISPVQKWFTWWAENK